MLETDDVDERIDAFKIRELHPTPAHAAGHAAIANRLARRARQAVRYGELPLLLFADDERSGETRFHRMEVPELAPPDFVHPDPFPRRPHEDHLLRHVPERPDAFARALEALRRARGQVLAGRIRLGTLARRRVQVRGPITGGLVVDGNHDGLL